MNAAHLLSERAASCGTRSAIIDGSSGCERTMSFGELELAAACAATRLRAAGLQPGDAVLVLVPMSVELYIALNALFRSGLVAMFLDPSAGRKHIESCCAMNPPKAFIGSPQAHWLRFISPALRRISVKFTTGRPTLGARSLLSGAAVAKAHGIEPCPAETPALIRFTSGSTGQPKAAVRTHGFLQEQQRVIEKSLRLTAGEVDLATLPIFVLANLASGVTSVIPDANLRAPGAVDPAPVLRQIRRHRPQRVSASPAFLECLADFCAHTFQRLKSFQNIYTGGAPVFPHLLDKFQAMSPDADIVAVYGSTEAEPIAQISRREISDADREAMWNGRGLLAGFPDKAIQLRILREADRECIGPLTAVEFEAVCQRRGEPGQIVVSGPHVQPGYLHGLGDHETKLRVNETTWHQTGDAGYLDPDGRLWLLGRSKARIHDEHGTLYPFQAECAAHRDPGVRRAAMVAQRGERLLAIESRTGVNIHDLTKRLTRLGIHRVQIVRRLPVDKRHNAKIDYAELRRIL
jgi:acyl-CoA synthetase (AMP-forming)/AMP-acid ligase II